MVIAVRSWLDSCIYFTRVPPPHRYPTKTIELIRILLSRRRRERGGRKAGKRFSKGGIWRYSSSFWSFGDERDRRSRVYLTPVPPLEDPPPPRSLLLPPSPPSPRSSSLPFPRALESFTHETSYNPSFQVARLVFRTLETTTATAGKTLAKHSRGWTN